MTHGVTPVAEAGGGLGVYPNVVPGAPDPVFEAARAAIQANFDTKTAVHGRLFLVAPRANLYQLYLGNFGPNTQVEGRAATPERQYHTCFADGHFINRWGRLAVLDDSGRLISAVWTVNEAVPERYRRAFQDMQYAVEHGKILYPFADALAMWGTPESGGFTHFAIDPPADCVFHSRTETPAQRMAQWRQDFIGLEKATRMTGLSNLMAAVNLLRNGNLQQAEAVLPQAEWFLEVLQNCGLTNPLRRNLLWKFVAAAPAGWCFPRSGMVGTVLDDLEKGLTTANIARKFNAKTAPTKFKTAQVAPTEGAIKVAEKQIATLGLEPALHRRFATFADVEPHLLWHPRLSPSATPRTGVFSHLRTKDTAPKTSPRAVAAPKQDITWEKFARTVLPVALKIEVLMSSMPMNFAAITTAEVPEAPPLLQWDNEQQRNPASWYVFPKGSPCTTWGLLPGTLVEATGIVLQPSMWHNPERFAHHGRSAIILLKGACDQSKFGNALFAAQVRSELHGIRSVITEYAKHAELFGRDAQGAAGLRVADGVELPHMIRVTTDVGVADYHIDRWD